MSHIFKILCQTGDINIFSFVVSFLVDIFTEKAPFSDNFTPAVVEKLSEVNVAKY